MTHNGHDAAPILDAAVLDELLASVDGDESFIADLLTTYVTEGEDHLAAMDAAVGARDPAAVVRPAHTLKSSSAALGATRLAEIARQIEMAGRAGDAEGLDRRVADARTTWNETLNAMRATGRTP
jgi:HPt (histidine-containing phosphotransfer) domain-containing protein